MGSACPARHQCQLRNGKKKIALLPISIEDGLEIWLGLTWPSGSYRVSRQKGSRSPSEVTAQENREKRFRLSQTCAADTAEPQLLNSLYCLEISSVDPFSRNN